MSVGGIDERFDYWGKEDLDLAARLKRAGADYVYDENLKSFHLSHPPNHVKDHDYLRMCALLEENNSKQLIEANVGMLWGNLNLPPKEEQEGTIIVEADNDLDDLARRLEVVIYSDGAARRDVMVICRETGRALVENFVASRYRPLKVVSLGSLDVDAANDRIFRHVRTERFVFLKPGSEFGEHAWELKSDGLSSPFDFSADRASRAVVAEVPAAAAGR